MDKETIISILRRENLILDSAVDVKPLKGGVSSDIFLVTDGQNSCVVKQALKKLKVEDDWYADISRNRNEQKFLRFLEKMKPNATPKLLYSDDDHHFFVMEYLDDHFLNWKKQMLNGVFEPQTAEKSAELLAKIHLKSRDNEEIKSKFNKTENFYTLRIEPYLITTGKRHPDLKKIFFDEAERLKSHQQALVHGDFSPKNIMVKTDQIILLDHEVAWYGDPAFDVAFFLNHLYLKMLFHYRRKARIKDLTMLAWKTYFHKMGKRTLEEMETRVIRLLLMLMLARVDGKSPVEYLAGEEKNFVRSFVKMHLKREVFTNAEINRNWKEKLAQITIEN